MDSESALQELNKELHNLNKSMTGIRVDLQEIHQALEALNYTIGVKSQ